MADALYENNELEEHDLLSGQNTLKRANKEKRIQTWKTLGATSGWQTISLRKF